MEERGIEIYRRRVRENKEIVNIARDYTYEADREQKRYKQGKNSKQYQHQYDT